MRPILFFLLLGGARCGDAGLGPCHSNVDCAPPASICGPAGRCVQGCAARPEDCPLGLLCDPGFGTCTASLGVNSPCGVDQDCDPPDLICDGTACQAGCTLGAKPCAPLTCNPDTGRCCDPTGPNCPQSPDGGAGCSADADCGAPARLCVGGACVAGCAMAGCPAPQTCNSATGHCAAPGGCARDADCDSGSYCTAAGACAPTTLLGAHPCAGGTPVTAACARKALPADFSACAGAPGPAGCPYCIDGSCFTAGLCTTDGDCHRGDACGSGLCTVKSPPCPSTVPLSAVAAGMFSAGKEVCVRDVVASAKSGYDGLYELKLGSTVPTLYADVPAMYVGAGVTLPSAGQTVTVHGTVRYDSGHSDWELLPVDFIGP